MDTVALRCAPILNCTMDDLIPRLSACTLCAPRFAATATAHTPRPVVWFAPGAKLLIAGQAPGMRVHASGKPFDDPSGERLRDWLGLTPARFYDRRRVAIVPMAFCFPGYDTKGADLPPPPLCRKTWHAEVMRALPDIRLRVIIGGYAHRYHLGTKRSVTETVQSWRDELNPHGRDHLPSTIPLPHPSWRNTAWLQRNPWFETDLLPVLRARVQEVLDD